MKTRAGILLAAAIVVSLFFGGSAIFGKEQSIKYLPRSEKVDIVSKSLGVTYTETPCAAAEELFKLAADCNYCVNTLKVNCPDCCLQFHPRALACTQENDSLLPLAFPADQQCKPVMAIGIPQSAGCGDPEPGPGNCAKDPSDNNAWICDEAHLTPLNPGCVPTAKAQAADPSCPNCTTGNVYVLPIKDKVACPGGVGPDPPHDPNDVCYQYKVSDDYRNCRDGCLNYTNGQETNSEAYVNCKKDVCKAERCPGVVAGCFDDACKNSRSDPETRDGNCDKRVDWPECDTKTVSECLELTNEATSCLTDSNGKCHSCFKPLDDQFFYRFVARSREKIIVIWQLTPQPEVGSQLPTYFYTMVKIIDDTTGLPVHESIVTQKSFQGSYSIFSATAQDALDEINSKVVLETGKPYKVVVYYFIPPLNIGMSIKIDSAQLIVIRMRH